MKKRIIISLVAAAVVVGGVAAMSAFEAHVINVTAHIENALYVHPKAIAFGTVFPQEYVERGFTVELSNSFQLAERVDDVEYVIKQKPKCECTEDGVTRELCKTGEHATVDYATHLCPDGFAEMENLCQFLSKVDDDPGDNNDTSHPSYYVEDASGDYCVTPTRYDSGSMGFSPNGWGGWSCPAGTHVVGGGYLPGTATVSISEAAKPGSASGLYPVYPHYAYTPPEEGWVVQNDNDNETITVYVDCLANSYRDATGRLSKHDGDLVDAWIVDLKVPPVEGFVGQDWPAGCPTVPTNDVDYGCDLWIEVTGISDTPE